jgi:hypothetical protein
LPTYKRFYTYTFGFAYAGSTLSALATHALASACTQNLTGEVNAKSPVSLEQVAGLFRAVSEHCTRDAASRVGQLDKPSDYFFEAFIFGYCPVEKKFGGFGIAPNMTTGQFQMVMATLVIAPGRYHPMGSGAEDLHAIMTKQQPDKAGVIYALREMINTEVRRDVGGHFQIGVAHSKGFDLHPILTADASGGRVTFLGWDVDSVQQVGGYRIGYQAINPDIN